MIQVYWFNNEKTIIRLDYESPVASWEEYHDAVRQSYDMARSVSHQVKLLHNPGNAAMPAGNALAELNRAFRKVPPNVDTVAMVITNSFARRIMQTVMYIMGLSQSYKIVQSVEEAEALLSTVDSSA